MSLRYADNISSPPSDNISSPLIIRPSFSCSTFNASSNLGNPLAAYATCILDAWAPAGVSYYAGIWKHNESSPQPSSLQRRLLAKGSSSRTSSSTARVSFHGYDVFQDTGIAYSLNDNLLSDYVTDLSRAVDSRRSNLILSGLYLHLTRLPQIISPSFPARFASVPQSIAQECSLSRFAPVIAQCQTIQSLAQISSSLTRVSSTHPFGSDPAFNYLSPLYDPTLSASDWYNTTSTDEVNPLTGLPYAFFHHPVQGYPDGYPLLISSFLGQGRVHDTL